MKKTAAFLVIIAVTSTLLAALASAQEDELSANIIARKSVVRVTEDGWVLTRLEVKNNGSTPVFRLEIYEYYNSAFVLGDNVTIRHGDLERIRGIPASSGGQFILEIVDPRLLGSGEAFEIRYWSRSGESGDFQIPTSIVWYSFNFKGNLLRTNVFSNGLLVHVKGEIERIVDRVLPYAISISVFAVTLLVLDYMRRNLQRPSERVKEKRLFR